MSQDYKIEILFILKYLVNPVQGFAPSIIQCTGAHVQPDSITTTPKNIKMYSPTGEFNDPLPDLLSLPSTLST